MVITVAQNPIVQLGFVLGEHQHKLAASTPLPTPRNLPLIYMKLSWQRLCACLRGFPIIILEKRKLCAGWYFRCVYRFTKTLSGQCLILTASQGLKWLKQTRHSRRIRAFSWCTDCESKHLRKQKPKSCGKCIIFWPVPRNRSTVFGP